MSPASGQRLNNEPLSHSTPACRNGVHANCADPSHCVCACHDDDDDDAVCWEDPPAFGGGRRTVVDPELLDALRRHPGRWAKVKEYKSASGASVAAKSFRLGKWGEPGFEVVGRGVNKSSALYMRYQPPT